MPEHNHKRRSPCCVAEAERFLSVEGDVREQGAGAASGYTLEWDEQHGWLVMSDPEGASEIIARDVRGRDAAYLLAGYDALVEKAAQPAPDVAGLLRERIEGMREAAMRQGTWGIEYGDDQFYRDVLAALPDEPVGGPE